MLCRAAMAAANWKNRAAIHTDNLGFLGTLDSESADFIAIAPPSDEERNSHTMPVRLADSAKSQFRSP